MDKTEIAAEIRRFVARESTISDESLLGDDVDLFSDGILDSLMVVSLVSFCEERFGCELSGQEFSEDDLRTIAALSTLVAGRRPEQH
jgi:acyl carrier protein